MNEISLGWLTLRFFASPIARAEQIDAAARRVARQLGETEAKGWDEPVFLTVVLTGGTEDQVLSALEGDDFSTPVVLLALPHSNSLPASLEILARLRQNGRAGRIIVGDRTGWREELLAALRVVRVYHRLRRVRLGLLGGASSWLAASTPGAGLVRAVWGPEVIPIALEEWLEAYGCLGGVDDGADDLAFTGAEVVEPDQATLAGAIGLYRALRELVGRYRLDALSARCFDLLGAVANTGCLALSRLNDEGIVAGCEGDLPATLTMLLVRELTGRGSFMANPSDLDVDRGTITFAHCTVPLSLVESVSLRSHFESGLGVGVAGRFAPGPMTVVRIGGRGLDEIAVFAGRLVDGRDQLREDLCRTQVTLEIGPEAVQKLLQYPLGNHHIVVPGDHLGAIQNYVGLVPGLRLI
ncbi:MAG: fucose isomerase [Bacillota bacterium]